MVVDDDLANRGVVALLIKLVNSYLTNCTFEYIHTYGNSSFLELIGE